MPLGSRGERKTSNRHVTSQKVIIPKGMINPDETTVIEIPARLHKQPVVVAKHKNSDVGRGLLCGSLKSQTQNSTSVNVKHEHYVPMEQVQVIPNYRRSKPKDITDLQSLQYTLGSLKNLDMTEEKERIELQKNLEEFQRARRRLLENATKLSTNDSPIPVKANNHNIGKQVRL